MSTKRRADQGTGYERQEGTRRPFRLLNQELLNQEGKMVEEQLTSRLNCCKQANDNFCREKINFKDDLGAKWVILGLSLKIYIRSLDDENCKKMDFNRTNHACLCLKKSFIMEYTKTNRLCRLTAACERTSGQQKQQLPRASRAGGQQTSLLQK